MCAIDITAEQRKTVLALLARHLPNTTAWVYGSRVKWTARPQSDLDLVVFATLEQAGRVSDLREAFEESNLAFRVDLFVWDDVPEQFRNTIKAEHVVLVERGELGVGGEWPIMSLREAGVSLIDCEHRTPPAAERGYPYVAIPQVKDGRINLNGVRRITRERFDEWTRKADPKSFDIVLSRRCNPGETGFVSEGLKFALGQNLVLLRSDGTKVFKPFLRWLVRGPRWWDQVGVYINVGAVFDSLKCGDIPGFRLPIPPLPEQRAIAHVLGTLDDKIELNRTLEAMARALFTSWFVDFDPVRAKMEGRDRGLPKGIAALFPDRLVDSELGEIPEGWEISEMGEEVDAVGGATPRTKDPAYWNEGQHHWATPKDLSKLLSPVLLGTDRKITDAGVQKISSGLLPPGTVLLSSRAPIGYLAIAEVPTAVNQGFIAMVCRRQLPNLYVLSWCYENLEHIKDISGGSTFAEINKKAFRPLPVVVPSKRVLGVYEDESRSLYDRVVSNTRESALLVSLRDTLLPKLVSGELRAKQIEPESSISNISPDTTGVQA